MRCFSKESASTEQKTGASAERVAVTFRVASARPKPGQKAIQRKPQGANISRNRSSVSLRTGSAPLTAATQLLRSSPTRSSGLTLRTQSS